ncbi:MAG: hypothetical protein ACKPJD_33395, partial [Planctomycetaceae bacterium]
PIFQLRHQDHLPLLIGELRIVLDHLADAGEHIIEEDGMTVDQCDDAVSGEWAAAESFHSGAAEWTGVAGTGFGVSVCFACGAEESAFFLIGCFIDQ